MNSKAIWWLMVILWCASIYIFTESPVSTGANTERIVEGTFDRLRVNEAKSIEKPFEQKSIHHVIEKINIGIRKSGHFLAFGLLAFLVWRAIYPGRFAYGAAWIFTALYAASDEYHQVFQPGRTPAVKDVIIDSVGALVVLMIVYFVLKLRKVRRHSAGV